jgi:hypothetical protein
MASTAEYDTPNPDTTEQASHRPTSLHQIVGSILTDHDGMYGAVRYPGGGPRAGVHTVYGAEL